MKPRLIFAVLLTCASLTAHATPDEDRRSARAHYKQGNAYQAAGAYDQAISEFEIAYRLTPLPALLFNLGQAHRLKGDKQAALENYRRFLEAQPDGRGSDEARTYVAQLTTSIAADEEAARKAQEHKPPEPTTVTPPVTSPPVVSPQVTSPQLADVVATPAPVKPQRVPVYKRWWVWAAIGGVAVVGLAVGLGVGLTRSNHYPSTTGATDGVVRW